MNQDRLKEFKRILEKQRAALLTEAEKTVNGMTASPGQFPDPADRASHVSDETFLLRIRDRERKLLLKIDEALERINDGSFGVCSVCGDDIPEQRLLVRPVTTLCIECKTKQEEQEKKSGG